MKTLTCLAVVVLTGCAVHPEGTGTTESAVQQDAIRAEPAAGVVAVGQETWPADGWERGGLRGLWAGEAGDIVAAGRDGLIITAGADGTWRPETVDPAVHWADVVGGDVRRVAVGSNGAIAEWDGQRWTVVASPTEEDLEAVWISSAGDRAVAVGAEGTIVGRTDDEPWVVELSLPGITFEDVHGLELDGVNELVAVGSSGTIARRVWSGWVIEESGTADRLSGIRVHEGQWVAVGSSGVVVRKGRCQWNVTKAKAPWAVLTLAVIDGELYAAGAWEWLGVWRDGEWETLSEGHCKARFEELARAPSGEVLTVGSFGVMTHAPAY